MKRDRKNMTTVENERRKREYYNLLYSDTRRMEEVFPDIERIEITYHNHYKSFLGENSKEGELSYTAQSGVIFVIPCLNPECSTVGFDLKNDIYSMKREHLTEFTGSRDCEGQEAPDHPEQSCGGSLKYTIKIFYK